MLGGICETAYAECREEIHEFLDTELLKSCDRWNIDTLRKCLCIRDRSLEILRIILGFVAIIIHGFVRNGQIKNRVIGLDTEVADGK